VIAAAILRRQNPFCHGLGLAERVIRGKAQVWESAWARPRMAYKAPCRQRRTAIPPPSVMDFTDLPPICRPCATASEAVWTRANINLLHALAKA